MELWALENLMVSFARELGAFSRESGEYDGAHWEAVMNGVSTACKEAYGAVLPTATTNSIAAVLNEEKPAYITEEYSVDEDGVVDREEPV
jgi:hypothetical protein